MIEEYIDHLNDIHRSMILSQQFTSELTIQEFLLDEKTQFAVIRCLEVIGEASKRIPQAYQDKFVEIPWKAMAGMRDRKIPYYISHLSASEAKPRSPTRSAQPVLRQ